MSKILVACEESQRVTIACRLLGHEAYSCDIQDCSGGHPEWHLKQDVLPLLESDEWDMIIAFPPCTDLACSGAMHFEKKRANGRQRERVLNSSVNSLQPNVLKWSLRIPLISSVVTIL